MPQFNIKIAGQTARVNALFDSTRDYCKAYLTEDTPQFSAVITREDMDFEQKFLLEEALQEGFRPRVFTDPFLERAALQRKFAEHLFCHDTLLFHGSAVAADGQGYLFTATSGTGKSTHTRLWKQVLGDRAVIVNDDKPFLRIEKDRVILFGSPWSGKHGLDANLAVPLKGLCVLERGTENSIRKLTAQEALPALLRHGVPPLSPDRQPRFQELTEALSRLTPLWHMQCTRDPEAALTAFEAMSH